MVEMTKAKTPASLVNTGIAGACTWRYRWDLNPRWAFTHTTFRELHLRPLGHGTADYRTRFARASPIGREAVAGSVVRGTVPSMKALRRILAAAVGVAVSAVLAAVGW